MLRISAGLRQWAILGSPGLLPLALRLNSSSYLRSPTVESLTMWSIETSGLSKSYGKIVSLADCTLRVREGCVFGLLGPNGAGKTTLIRTLMGFIHPTSGRAKVCGYDIVEQSLQVRRQVSYLPGDARLYRSMRGKDVLELFAGLHQYGDLANSIRISEQLELDVSRRVMFMSTGMRQKLAIALVLGSAAPLVILDEPTANLDPDVRRTVLRLLSEVRDRGSTVVLSSHIFSDIDEACDEVAILRSGRLVATHDLRSVEQLHIVKLLPSSMTKSSMQPKRPEFVQFQTQTPQHDLMHLSGPPTSWLPWLAEQTQEVLDIEKAGVRAIYDRYLVPQTSDATEAKGELA